MRSPSVKHWYQVYISSGARSRPPSASIPRKPYCVLVAELCHSTCISFCIHSPQQSDKANRSKLTAFGTWTPFPSRKPRALSVTFSFVSRCFTGSILPPPNFFSRASTPGNDLSESHWSGQSSGHYPCQDSPPARRQRQGCFVVLQRRLAVPQHCLAVGF
jgi:hypothetical protein